MSNAVFSEHEKVNECCLYICACSEAAADDQDRQSWQREGPKSCLFPARTDVSYMHDDLQHGQPVSFRVGQDTL